MPSRSSGGRRPSSRTRRSGRERSIRSDPTDVWAEADPKVRAWVEENREALALFLRGAELTEGISRPAGQPHSPEYSFINPRELVNLALLEGARRAE